MKKRMIEKICCSLLLVSALFALSGCGESYSKDHLEREIEEAYQDGYNAGYERGASDQMEKDYEELLIDGESIRTIEEKVYAEYGLTPQQAFNITEDYNYDSDHGGYSWEEYQNAIEAIYCTVSIFPSDD